MHAGVPGESTLQCRRDGGADEHQDALKGFLHYRVQHLPPPIEH